MCLIVFDWRPAARAGETARLTLAANRDEFFDRAATPLHWWPDAPLVLAGRDLQGGGTWLGLHRDGRFAALTNYRAPTEKQLDGPSRGLLVANFLRGPSITPLAYLEQLAQSIEVEPASQQHGKDGKPGAMRGFNLLTGNLADGTLAYYGNRTRLPPRLLPAGCYGLSNALLDTDWPKVRAKKAALQEILEQGPSGSNQLEALLAMLHDTREAPDAALPDTGLPLARERALSAAYIVSPGYGTRCTTALQLSAAGHIEIVERGDSQADGSRIASGGYISRYRFQLETPQQT